MFCSWQRTAVSGVVLGVIASLSVVSRAASNVYAPAPVTRPDVTFTYSADSGNKTFPAYGGVTNNPTSDTLNFAGLKFTATSTDGGSSDATECLLTVDLLAKTGQSITRINWSEGGGYDVRNSTGTGNNTAGVQNGFFDITVKAINNQTLATPLHNMTVPMTFPHGNFFQTAGPSAANGSWNGLGDIDLNALFGVTGITDVSIAYDNHLYATSASGGTGTITKSYVVVSPTLAAVPEPATMAALALAGLLMRRSRRA